MNLELKSGIFWSIIWFFILVILGNKSLTYSLLNSFTFFVTWIIISFLLLISCEYLNFCF